MHHHYKQINQLLERCGAGLRHLDLNAAHCFKRRQRSPPLHQNDPIRIVDVQSAAKLVVSIVRHCRMLTTLDLSGIPLSGSLLVHLSRAEIGQTLRALRLNQCLSIAWPASSTIQPGVEDFPDIPNIPYIDDGNEGEGELW